MREGWKLGYRPGLDGMRAIAATLVVLDHAKVPWCGGGGLGVDVFFVLSGFLITSLLVEELQQRDTVGLPRFWMRRALRLLPAVFALVAVVVVFQHWMPRRTMNGVKPTLLYYTNWERALHADVGALGHTWSLSVEEQFYLLWPLLLIGLWRLDRTLHAALRLTVLAIVVVGVAREVAWQTGWVRTTRWYNGSDFRADGLLTGCALAIVFHIVAHPPKWLAGTATGLLGVAAFWAVFLGRQIWGDPYAAERTVVNLATAAVLAALMVGAIPRIDWVLSRRPMRWTGARSYGLYLWHYPIARVLLATERTPTRQAAVIVFSFLAAAVSYRFVEAPFLRLKDRLDRRPRLPVLGVEVAGQVGPIGARQLSRHDHDLGNVAVEPQRVG